MKHYKRSKYRKCLKCRKRLKEDKILLRNEQERLCVPCAVKIISKTISETISDKYPFWNSQSY